jgi:hypothetical protein
MRNIRSERELLVSISEYGIREPLQGVDSDECLILLNGFKRYRCAKKLGIGIVPYSSLGSDEVFGIIKLIRIANSKNLTMLEQARLIDELRSAHKMSVSEIAGLLEKSKSWVSMRIGIIGEMSDGIQKKVFSGAFPAYCYIYSLRKFRRLNGITKEQIEEFVQSVSGKHLSIRDIDLLAHGYFHGSKEFREQITGGDIAWGLSRMKEHLKSSDMVTTCERGMLKDLAMLKKYMQRVTYKGNKGRFKTNTFYAQANLVAQGILRQLHSFSQTIRELHDQTGKT